MKTRSLCAGVSLATALIAGPAYAQGLFSRPQSSTLDFVQYGVGLTAESLLNAGKVCPDGATAPCILGSGLGFAVRMGYRSPGPLYVGGAYEATRHDTSNILRLGLLQQLRGEARYLLDRGTRLSPYGLGGLGVAIYGNEWGAETIGPTLHLGAGVEFQASTSAVVGFSAVWRGISFCKWTDSTGQQRSRGLLGFGLSQWLGLELILEIRNRLARW